MSLTAAYLVCKQSIHSRQQQHGCGGCKQIILLTTIKRNSQRVKNCTPTPSPSPSPFINKTEVYMYGESVCFKEMRCGEGTEVIAFTYLVLAHCPHFIYNCINLLFALFCLSFSHSLSLSQFSSVFFFLQSPAEWRRCGWLRWRQWRRRWWPIAQRQPQIAAAIVKVAHAARHHFARTSGRLAAHG